MKNLCGDPRKCEAVQDPPASIAPVCHDHRGKLQSPDSSTTVNEENTGLLLGVQEGAELLARLPLIGRRLVIDGDGHEIIEAELAFGEETVGPSAKLESYRFQTPWLPFNQKNYERFLKLPERDRPQELNRIAVGNLLSLLKGLEYVFPDRLYASFLPERDVRCRYKDQDFVGFMGVLTANVILPTDLAIGRPVSHGFGWLGRL